MSEGGRVALVTGGTRGIGLGIARCLAAEHWNLALCGVRAPGAAEEAVAEVRAFGVQVQYFRADIGERADRESLLESVRDRFGRLHLLVNNAGVAPLERADILDASEESFDRLMRVNLKGPYFLTQAAARWMITQRQTGPGFSGCIVNITSISAAMASTNRGDYCLTKAALAMATQLWAARLAEFGIAVYELRPGIIRTDMTAPVQDKYDRLIEAGLIPESRWGAPEDVGKAVAILARGELTYATGTVLNVDGGLSIARL